jgi:hypothetical protein
VFQNGGHEVLHCCAFHRVAFVSGSMASTLGLSFGNPNGAHRRMRHAEVSGSTLRSFPSGPLRPGVFGHLVAEQPDGYVSTEVSSGSPPHGLLREPTRRCTGTEFSLGSSPGRAHRYPRLRHHRQASDPIRESTRLPVATPGDDPRPTSIRSRSSSAAEMKGAGRVSADAGRTTVRCWQQVSGPAAGRAPVWQPPST